MNRRHTRTLRQIFRTPVPSAIKWVEVEALLVSIGAELKEGEGSRVRVRLNDVRATFHRPHPNKEIDKGAVVSLRRFLINAGIIL